MKTRPQETKHKGASRKLTLPAVLSVAVFSGAAWIGCASKPSTEPASEQPVAEASKETTPEPGMEAGIPEEKALEPAPEAVADKQDASAPDDPSEPDIHFDAPMA